MAKGTYTLEIQGLSQAIEDFKKAGVNYVPIIRQAMVKATERVKNRIQQNIVNQGITFQGNLGRSVGVREATEEKGVVGVGERYGSVVEFGREPGKMPPVAPIERWASIKLGSPGAGFAIARKIKMVGTKGNPYVKPAFESEAEPVTKIFADGINVIVQMMAGTYGN